MNMQTAFDSQREKKDKEGFEFYKTVEKPVLSDEEQKIVNLLIEHIEKQRDKTLGTKIHVGMGMAEFYEVYPLFPKVYLDLFYRNNSSSVVKSTLRKLKKMVEYDKIIQNLTTFEGNMVHEDKAFDNTGEVRLGFTNIYCKHPDDEARKQRQKASDEQDAEWIAKGYSKGEQVSTALVGEAQSYAEMKEYHGEASDVAYDKEGNVMPGTSQMYYTPWK
jgi:hypothetical protein